MELIVIKLRYKEYNNENSKLLQSVELYYDT